MKKGIILLLSILFVACEIDNPETGSPEGTQEDLRSALGLKPSSYSKEEIETLKNQLEPKLFKNLAEAKGYVRKVKETSYQIVITQEDIESAIKKGDYKQGKTKGTYDIQIDEFLFSVPCDSQFLDPIEGCDDSGGNTGGSPCGSGTQIFSTNTWQGPNINQSVSWGSSTNGAGLPVVNPTGGESFINGVTLGYDWDQIGNTQFTTYAYGSICFETLGNLNTVIGVPGFNATIHTQTYRLNGCFNPCYGSGGGGGLELYLTPVN